MRKCIDCGNKISGIKRCRNCYMIWLNSGPSKKSQYLQNHKGMIGDENPSWKGGIKVNDLGYIFKKTKIGRGSQTYEREHRFIFENLLNRKLKQNEVIHHVDGDVKNNKIGNLLFFRSNGAHLRFEFFMKRNNLKNLIIKQDWLYVKFY